MEKSRQKHRKVTSHDSLGLTNLWVLLIIVIRILSAGAILIHPFWGIILYWICDSRDWYILHRFAGYTNQNYHYVDKPLDFVGLLCMYIVAYQKGLGVILGILLLYRLIGYVIFLIFHKRWMFVLFPNFFEMAFVWFVVLPSVGVPISWIAAHTTIGLIGLFILKIGIEIHLHVYQPIYFHHLLKLQKK